MLTLLLLCMPPLTQILLYPPRLCVLHSLQTMLLMHLARHAPKSLPTNVRRLAEQTSQ
jgi:hypothetical protein